MRNPATARGRVPVALPDPASTGRLSPQPVSLNVPGDASSPTTTSARGEDSRPRHPHRDRSGDGQRHDAARHRRRPVPMQVGAVLLFDSTQKARPGHRPAGASRRIEGVPRLRQRLVRLLFGCGRPVWVDDDTFSVDAHVAFGRAPAPGDEAALTWPAPLRSSVGAPARPTAVGRHHRHRTGRRIEAP